MLLDSFLRHRCLGLSIGADASLSRVGVVLLKMHLLVDTCCYWHDELGTPQAYVC